MSLSCIENKMRRLETRGEKTVTQYRNENEVCWRDSRLKPMTYGVTLIESIVIGLDILSNGIKKL